MFIRPSGYQSSLLPSIIHLSIHPFIHRVLTYKTINAVYRH